MIFIFGIIASLIALVPSLYFNSIPDVSKLALLGSVGMSCTGSSIFYIRKLYKSCITQNLILSNEKEKYLERLGTLIYYIARPIFAIGFSILVVIGLKSGLMVITNKQAVLDDGYINASMFIAFFVGFLTGKFIKNLEIKGENIIDNLIAKGGKNDGSR